MENTPQITDIQAQRERNMQIVRDNLSLLPNGLGKELMTAFLDFAKLQGDAQDTYERYLSELLSGNFEAAITFHDLDNVYDQREVIKAANKWIAGIKSAFKQLDDQKKRVKSAADAAYNHWSKDLLQKAEDLNAQIKKFEVEVAKAEKKRQDDIEMQRKLDLALANFIAAIEPAYVSQIEKQIASAMLDLFEAKGSTVAEIQDYIKAYVFTPLNVLTVSQIAGYNPYLDAGNADIQLAANRLHYVGKYSIRCEELRNDMLSKAADIAQNREKAAKEAMMEAAKQAEIARQRAKVLEQMEREQAAEASALQAQAAIQAEKTEVKNIHYKAVFDENAMLSADQAKATARAMFEKWLESEKFALGKLDFMLPLFDGEKNPPLGIKQNEFTINRTRK